MNLLPPSPFLSASDGLHPLSSVAVTLGATLQLENVTAEIPPSAALVALTTAGPADVTSTSPEAMSAGTNTAWVRDCDRIELQEIQSSDGDGSENRQTSTGNMPGSVPGEEMSSSAASFGRVTVRGAATQHQSGVAPGPSEASAATTPIQGPVAAERLNEAASAPLLELHEFLGTGVQAPRPIGPWPRGFDPAAFLRAIEEAWIAGIDEPDPLLFLETFKLGEVA